MYEITPIGQARLESLRYYSGRASASDTVLAAINASNGATLEQLETQFRPGLALEVLEQILDQLEVQRLITETKSE